MAPEDPHPDDEPEARDHPDPGEADGPEVGGEAAAESDALVRLRELRARVRGQFDSLHSEIESLRRPSSDDDPVEAVAEPEPPAEQPEDAAAGAAVEEPELAPEVPEEPDAGAVMDEIVWSSPAEGEVEPDEPLDGGLDLAAAGAGVDPGIFYAPREDAGRVPGHPDDLGAGTTGAGGSTVFDIEAEGWEATPAVDPPATVPPDAAPEVPADGVRLSGAEPEPGAERGGHGLPDWVFGAEDQPPATPPPTGQPLAATPWPDAAPLGDAEQIFSPPGAAVRRVVVAVLVFALVVALVILVIQLLDDGEPSAPADGAAPAAAVQAAPPLPA